MASEDSNEPQTHREHHGDTLATKLFDRTNGLGRKTRQKTPGLAGEKKGPAGGFEDTPVPKATPGYTLRFTFHRATSLPMADLNSLSSDPYVLAQLNTSLSKRHKQDPNLRFRTPTIRRSTDPEWNSVWIVANVPASGFKLKARIYDEDPADHDDRLGNVHVNVDHINEDWEGIREQAYKIRKRMGSKRAYAIRGCAAMFNRRVPISGDLIVSVQVLGRSQAEYGGRMYTIGPCDWTQHLSPLIGRLTGTKDPRDDNDENKTEKYNFQANQVQLAGPVPEPLYHRYVEFKPFVAGMFTSHSLRGRLLNRALHHQHARVYNYDRTTVYGSFPSPSKDFSLQFLKMVHYDQGGRIFTYILTLDGLWRFTETGEEFGIDMLSKHTMHSDVSIYIAFSGEFFIRRLTTPWKDPEEQESHPPAEINGGLLEDKPPNDPAYYQLVIDNDSGTYRPNAKLLPQLKDFLHRNLPGLKITTLDCMGDKGKMDKMKRQQRERRKAEGKTRAYVQPDDAGSISSSDEEELDAATGQSQEKGKLAQAKNKMAEPKDAIRDWVQGDKERERREEEEDMVGG